MTLSAVLTPDLILSIGEGKTNLAQAAFKLKQAGLDLFENTTHRVQQASAQQATCLFTLAGGSQLCLEIQVKNISSQAVEVQTCLSNPGASEVMLEGLQVPLLSLDPHAFPTRGLWSMQGAVVAWGQDFAFELPAPFQRDNYLGHLQDAEGGGIPVNYFWTQERGLAVMHIEPVPQEYYFPVLADENQVQSALELRAALCLKPGQSYACPRVVISSHKGDFFAPLALYRELMAAQQVGPAQPTPACYEPAWCSWGYEFDVTAAQMLGVLPALEPLGIHWLTLDDRWFDTYGDWNPRRDTFPGGGAEMRQMNEQLHAAGYKNQIWWYPLCAEDLHSQWESHAYIQSKILEQHPDWVVLHADGSVARNNRHLAMLCPALPEVQAYTRALTELFIRDWDFDGHKLDNIYTMPACHNPAHHHTSPQDSVAAFAEVYRIIFETTLKYKPDSVTQICPCGTPLTHSLMPYTNQTVTADPTSSQQIRQRIKFYKALMGPQAAVFADHVELSDGGCDFASELGTGGVLATKFVYPEDEQLKAVLKEYWSMPPEKLALWKKWFDLANRLHLEQGETLNLYDLAFDLPEGHAIRKDENIHYAFYASDYEGELELRGLEKKTYRLRDTLSGQELGLVEGPTAHIPASFKGYVLLNAAPC